MDKLVHGIAAEGSVRIMAAITTDTVAEAVRRHETSPSASAALGRVLTGNVLLGASLKDYDRLTIKIDCDGPVGAIVSEATPGGSVRGYVRNPGAESPAKDNGKIDVSGIIGNGTFYVIRESGFELGLHHEPYVGSVPIVSGEIAKDFAHYLAKSEQVPSAVMLGELLKDAEPFVAASGGVLIQMMPDANDHIVTMIEETIRHAPRLTSAINDGAGPEDLVKIALGIIDYKILDKIEIQFKCNCSVGKAISMITSLGKEEIEDMIKTDNGAVMDCGFCSETYRLDADELHGILDSY